MRFLVIASLITWSGMSQQIALLKYNGGGDWYANPTALPNLIQFCNNQIDTHIAGKPITVDAGSPELFSYPFVHMTGHGNVVFNNAEIENLKKYLEGGGFLHVDDNYGMDQYIRREIKRIFPNNALVEIPASHILFQKPFVFSKGLPKIHEHDGKRPEALAIILNGRIALLYTHETDLGDGWEDEDVHHDPKEVRETALKMGANIIYYVFNN